MKGNNMRTVMRFCCLGLIFCFAIAGFGEEKVPSPSPSPAKHENSRMDSAGLAEARKLIAEANAKWVEGWRKGDPAMVASIFAEEGIQLRKRGAVISGRQAILESQRKAMEACEPGVEVTVETAQVWVAGGDVYETGSWTYKYSEKGKQASETETGRYVTLWRKQKDGSLKIYMDMDVPLDASSTWTG